MRIIAEQEHSSDLLNIINHDALRDVPRKGIVHVGADTGQEVPQYLAYGFSNIILIEANPDPFKTLASLYGDDPRIKLFNTAICDRQGTIDFHIHTSRSGSTEPSSILRMKRFSEIVKTLETSKTITVPATTLDALFDDNGIDRSSYNFINIDIQGAELLAFTGAARLLQTIDAIISEVNVVEMYQGCVLEADLVAFLSTFGFERRHAVYHTLYDENSTFPAWGESLFLRKSLESRR